MLEWVEKEEGGEGNLHFKVKLIFLSLQQPMKLIAGTICSAGTQTSTATSIIFPYDFRTHSRAIVKFFSLYFSLVYIMLASS